MVVIFPSFDCFGFNFHFIMQILKMVKVVDAKVEGDVDSPIYVLEDEVKILPFLFYFSYFRRISIIAA